MRAVISGLALSVLCALGAAGETVQCKTTRDVWLSCCGKEAEFNMGAAPRIKMKGWQEFGLADFDVSALKGKKIVEAFLCVKPAGGHKLGLNGGSDLKWLSVSTISHDWVEGKSANYGEDAAGSGATFNESSFKKDNWGWPGAKCWDVILGNGNTLRCETTLDPANGWLKGKIDPRLVQALVSGTSHGLCLMDGSIFIGANQYISSREGGGNGPYLEVVVGGDDSAATSAPADVKIEAAPNSAGQAHGAAQLSLKVPKGAFAYHVKLNGSPLVRWQVPFAGKEGETQSFTIVDLEPETELKIEIAAVSAAGVASPFVAASGKASPKLTVPALPAYGFAPKPGEPKALGQAKVWAFPEVTKVDPVSGNVLHEKTSGEFRKANAVWDGSTGTVRLAAARGEIVSFQIAVEGAAQGCKVAVSALKGPGEIPEKGVRLWRNWYVGSQSEYALPLTGAFDCPSSDNNIQGQTVQAVTVDCHVPADTKAGDYEGKVTVSSGDAKAELALKVKVYDVVIPEDIHFNPELNCYGGPGTAGSDKFKDSFRLAHYHRCTINRVPYNQGGSVHADWSPAVDEKGRVTDWSRFDSNLGGLLDGSWFKDNPRSGVPVPTFYLPLFEGWPLNYRKHYNPGPGVPVNGKDPKEALKHNTLALPIEKAMDQAFQDAWVACVGDFVAHFKEKGWTRTIVECYLNNKPNYGYTMWTLDEPTVYLDWAALNFFGGLWKKGIADPEVYKPSWHEDLFVKGLAGMKRDRATFLFRGDISRPMWQGNCSDGLMNIVYLGGAAFNLARLTGDMKRRAPTVLYCYGSCNGVDKSNWDSAAWCLKSYTLEADGVLPWQSLADAGALTKANPEALLIDAGKHGHAVASFRVHALRRGAQDCELLRLLQIRKGWSRGHIGVLVSQKVPLDASFRQKFSDEAAAVSFGNLTGQGFCELKEGVLQMLSGK